ncbi:hypothetical protein BS17DRAFT_786499 [Gyrodon lividus]|nr:hypothetical protein BS17DRAFT_786499 [Gyrodon lividus]
MQFLLTFLAAITSLSTYALVGVHADPATQCAACPSSVDGLQLQRKCYLSGGESEEPSTTCYYGDVPIGDSCSYNANGYLVESAGMKNCPLQVYVDSSDCPDVCIFAQGDNVV